MPRQGMRCVWLSKLMLANHSHALRRLGTQVEDLGEGAGLRFGVPAA